MAQQHCKSAILMCVLLLSACAAPTAVPFATSTAAERALPTPALTAMDTTTPVPTFVPIPTPVDTPAVESSPTPARQMFVPKATIDPVIAPDKLLAEIDLVDKGTTNGHRWQGIIGWDYGWRNSGYCADGPYRWLDDDHLLLYPIIGEEEGMGVRQDTLPMVISIASGNAWLPAQKSPTRACNVALWSDRLNTLISSDERQVALYEPDGNLIGIAAELEADCYEGGECLFLSPSGRHLLVASTWIDLESNRQVTFNADIRAPRFVWDAAPAWSTDETRVFRYALMADSRTGETRPVQLPQLYPPGMGGPGPGYAPAAQDTWVLGDTRIVGNWHFYLDEDYKKRYFPLIDPMNGSYMDFAEALRLPPTYSCMSHAVSPDRQFQFVWCGEPSEGPFETQRGWHLVNLQSFSVTALTEMESNSYPIWSPDSRFAAAFASKSMNSGKFVLIPVDGNPASIAYESSTTPVWNSLKSELAYLSPDGRELVFLDATIGITRKVGLPQPFKAIFWRPQGDALALQADDGSLWWVPGLSDARVEPLTPAMADVRDVRWSPSGTHLAYVHGADVCIVSVTGVSD